MIFAIIGKKKDTQVKFQTGRDKMMCGLCDKHSEHCEHGEGVGGTDWERTTNLVKLCVEIDMFFSTSCLILPVFLGMAS